MILWITTNDPIKVTKHRIVIAPYLTCVYVHLQANIPKANIRKNFSQIAEKFEAYARCLCEHL